VSQESLRQLLKRVHERLSSSGAIDSESRELLRIVMRDIERALDLTPAAASSAPASQAGLHASRLESLAVEFEAGHPGLAEVVRELVDALGKAGI
jgi:predicted component of type VI protein secretion system